MTRYVAPACLLGGIALTVLVQLAWNALRRASRVIREAPVDLRLERALRAHPSNVRRIDAQVKVR